MNLSNILFYSSLDFVYFFLSPAGLVRWLPIFYLLDLQFHNTTSVRQIFTSKRFGYTPTTKWCYGKMDITAGFSASNRSETGPKGFLIVVGTWSADGENLIFY